MLSKIGMPLVYTFMILSFLNPVYGIAFYLAFDFLNPDYYVPGYMDVHMNSIFMCILFITVLIHRRDISHPGFFKALLCFIVATTLSTIINGITQQKGSTPFFAQVQIAKCTMLSMVLIMYIRTRKELLIVYGTTMAALIANAVFAVMQCWFGFEKPRDPEIFWDLPGFGGFLSTTTSAGIFPLILSLPLIYYLFQHATKRSLRGIFGGMLALSSLAVFLCNSRAAVVGLCLFWAIILLKDTKKISTIFIAALVFFIVFNYASDKWERDTIVKKIGGTVTLDSSSAARFKYWSQALNVLLHNPALGSGPGKYQQEVRKLYNIGPNIRVGTGHNSLLMCLAEWGLLGFIPFICFPIMAWRSLGRMIRTRADFYCEYATYYRAGLTAFFFCAMFFSLFSVPEAWAAMVLPLALEKIYTRESQPAD